MLHDHDIFQHPVPKPGKIKSREGKIHRDNQDIRGFLLPIFINFKIKSYEEKRKKREGAISKFRSI